MSPRRQWRAHPGLGRAYGAVTVFAAFLGLTLLLGDDSRLKAAAFTTMREVGGSTFWGLVLLGGAVALVVAVLVGPRLARIALFAGAFMHGLLALWFFLAAWHDPAASFWGFGVFALVSFWHISQAMEYGTWNADA